MTEYERLISLVCPLVEDKVCKNCVHWKQNLNQSVEVSEGVGVCELDGAKCVSSHECENGNFEERK